MLGGGFGGLRGFFNAYGAYPGIWVEKDGQLAYGAIQPECKTALAALHDMYEKGYIDTEFGVKDSTKAGEAAAAGKCGFTFGQQWLSLTPFQSCKDNDPGTANGPHIRFLPQRANRLLHRRIWAPTDGLL